MLKIKNTLFNTASQLTVSYYPSRRPSKRMGKYHQNPSFHPLIPSIRYDTVWDANQCMPNINDQDIITVICCFHEVKHNLKPKEWDNCKLMGRVRYYWLKYEHTPALIGKLEKVCQKVSMHQTRKLPKSVLFFFPFTWTFTPFFQGLLELALKSLCASRWDWIMCLNFHCCPNLTYRSIVLLNHNTLASCF